MEQVSEKHSTPPEPISVDAAEDAILALSNEIDMIQAQLSDMNRLNKDGERMSDAAYHQWRHRAVFAMKAMTNRRRTLKAWVKKANAEAARIEAGVERPGNVVELLGAMLRAMRDMSDWDDMTPREQALVRLAENYIRSKGVTAILRARKQAEVAS